MVGSDSVKSKSQQNIYKKKYPINHNRYCPYIKCPYKTLKFSITYMIGHSIIIFSIGYKTLRNNIDCGSMVRISHA